MPSYPVELPISLWILLGVNSLVLLLVLAGQLRTGSRLKRIERALGSQAPAAGGLSEGLERQKSENKEQKQLFQQYLAEDPARKVLPKREQFEGFRKWRAAKGLNWQ